MSQSSSEAEFKYDDLEEPVVIQLKKIACAIGNHTRSGSKKILAIGLALLDAKQPLKHGQFHGWVVSQSGFSIRTAERYMRAAEDLEDKFDTVSHLQPSTIYRLSAKNMPASVIEQVLAQLNERPALSDIGVNELIDQWLLVEKPASAAPFEESTPSPLIKAWKEAPLSDRNALLDSDREALVNGAWRLMTSDEQTKFVRDRKKELAPLQTDTESQELRRDKLENANIVQLATQPEDTLENTEVQCA